jgi:L-rhamnose mutarotase
MRTLLFVSFAVLSAITAPTAKAAEKETRLFEMRTYYAAPGKLDALHARFRDHTMKLFEKHGITNIGYWVPIDNRDNKLIYVIAFPSLEARNKAFRSFGADPEWQKVYKESEKNGKLVNKIENVFLTATDYSPPIKAAKSGNRVFELRTYTASKGNLDLLNARFRDHTMKLFEKHGMTNVAYWVLAKDQKGAQSPLKDQADVTLVYLLAHQSSDAAKKSFDAFRNDPAWIKARQASEEKGGGSLTVKDGVKSLFLTATDYSPLK